MGAGPNEAYKCKHTSKPTARQSVKVIKLNKNTNNDGKVYPIRVVISVSIIMISYEYIL